MSRAWWVIWESFGWLSGRLLRYLDDMLAAMHKGYERGRQ